MRYKDLRQKLLKSASVRDAFKEVDLSFEVSSMLVKARTLKGFTQEELATALGTKQSNVARLEKGRALPSLTTLARIASVYSTYLIPPMFGFLQDKLQTIELSFGSNVAMIPTDMLVLAKVRNATVNSTEFTHTNT